MSSSSRKHLENYLKNLSVECESVIDFGGAQNPITGRLASLKCNDYKIADLTIPHHTKHQPDIRIDLNKKNQLNGRFKEQFDVGFCLEVMEYIWNPVQAIQNMNYFLKKSGTLYISFTFLYPIHPPQNQDFLRYTQYGAVKLLNECGFRVEELVYRPADDPTAYMRWCGAEGFRYDRSLSTGEMTAVGVIIKATKQ